VSRRRLKNFVYPFVGVVGSTQNSPTSPREGYLFFMGDAILATAGRMTSLEISELTRKSHAKVLRDIDNLFIEL
jgi:hypothetical protein